MSFHHKVIPYTDTPYIASLCACLVSTRLTTKPIARFAPSSARLPEPTLINGEHVDLRMTPLAKRDAIVGQCCLQCLGVGQIASTGANLDWQHCHRGKTLQVSDFA